MAEHRDMLAHLPCRIVFDHMGRLDPHLGVRDPAFSVLCALIDRGSVWVKLSGPYLNTVSGYPWEDACAVAQTLAAFAPDRVVWGSDFPHVTERDKPAPESLIEQIPRWLPDARAQRLALADNPKELYGF